MGPLAPAVPGGGGALWRHRPARLAAPPLRSLLAVRISRLNGCAFRVDLNSATLLKRGIPIAKVPALAAWRGSELFDAREAAALDYGEAVTLTGREVDEALFRRLGAQFEPDAVIEPTVLIAFQNLSGKFNAALAVPPRGFRRLPPAREE